MRSVRLLSIGELVDAGLLSVAVEREAAACEYDGYDDTARLLRALLASAQSADAPGAVPVPEGEPGPFGFPTGTDMPDYPVAPEKNDSGAPDGAADALSELRRLAEYSGIAVAGRTGAWIPLIAVQRALANVRPQGASGGASETDHHARAIRAEYALALGERLRQLRQAEANWPGCDGDEADPAELVRISAEADDVEEERHGLRRAGHEGMVTVWDYEGRYVGCMGADTWSNHVRDELTARADAVGAPIVAPLGEGEQSADRTIKPSESAPDGTSVMPRVGGKRFVCMCGCSVFTRFVDEYRCNGCPRVYVGTAIAQSGHFADCASGADSGEAGTAT